MLNPAYLAEALGRKQEGGGRKDDAPLGQQGQKRPQAGLQDRVNTKLKQCYEAKAQIRPFYSGGKIAVIDDEEFVCQHGPCIKVFRRARAVKSEETMEDEESNGYKTSFSISKTFEVELDDVLSFDSCPITRVVITAHKSNLLRIWCLVSGQLLRTIKSLHNMPIGHVEICKLHLKSTLANVRGDLEEAIEEARTHLCWVTVSGASVKLWQLGGNQMSKLVRIENITALGYVRWEATKFYAAERNINVMGVDPKTKQFGVLKSLEGHYSQVTGIEFGPDNVMISGGRDKVIILWNTADNFSKLKTFPFSNSIVGIFLSRPHDLFVAVDPSCVLDTKDTQTSKKPAIVEVDPSCIYHMNSKDGKTSKKPILKLNGNENITGFYTSSHPTSANVNTCLITSHTGTIYEVMKKKVEDAVRPTLEIVHQYVGDLDEILCAVLWKDSKVAVANNTSVIKVYDLTTGSCTFLRGHSDIVLSLNCHEDWMVSSAKDNNIIYWKYDSLEPQKILSGHTASVTSVCFNVVKNMIYSVSRDLFLKSWDKERLLSGVVAHDKEINSVQCSLNGALVLTASRDKTAKVWDSNSLQLIQTFKGHRKGVWSAKFSSWDELVVTASADTTIKIWSLRTFDCVKTLQGHQSSVLQVQFINSGLQVLSVSSDGCMKSWDLKTSTCILTDECGNDKIWTLDASPEGDVVITGSADGVLTLWRDITEEKIEQATEKKKKMFQDEQKLSNLLNAKQWMKAFEMAIQMDRPFTLLKVIREVNDIDNFRPVIEKLEDDHLLNLINYITKWNTNTKTSTEAQILLNIIVRSFPEEYLSRFVQPMQILSYTEKHHERIYRMIRQTSFLKFLVNEHANDDGELPINE